MRSKQRILEQLSYLYLNSPLKSDRRHAFRHAKQARGYSPREIRSGGAGDEERRHGRSPLTGHRCANEPSESELAKQLTQSIDGAAPLVARCPHEHLVRMMADETGRIHLWRGRVDRDINAGIVSLINARFWARENIELIALTQPEVEFDLWAEPILHVFTSDADKASALDQSLGPCLKIHVVESLSDRVRPMRDERRCFN